MEYNTSELCDTYIDVVDVVEPMFSNYGGCSSFGGSISTIKCFEDNSLVEEALKMNGKGCVLVVDAGESLRCAMLGDKRASDAIKNEWEGIVVNGSIRDSVMINSMTIGIRALGVCPRKSIKKGNGKRNLTVDFSNVKFIPNHFLYADEDGVIVIENKVNS